MSFSENVNLKSGVIKIFFKYTGLYKNIRVKLRILTEIVEMKFSIVYDMFRNYVLHTI